MENLQRNDSVTISKAIGIMLMVLAHSGFSRIGDAAINMFHMPLFFFMSGYCFSDRHLQNPKKWLRGKVLHIYLPYVKYSLIFLFAHNLLFCLHIYRNSYSLHDFLFRGVRIIVSMGLHDQLLGGYWFMSALFWGLIISYGLLWICRNNEMAAGMASLAVAVVMNYFDVLIPVIRIDQTQFFASAFILSGIWYKRRGFQYETKPLVVLPLSILLVIVGTKYWRACVPYIEYYQIPLYFVTAIVSTLGVFSIAKLLKNGKSSKTFKQVGGGTLSILTWHFLSFKLVSIIIVLVHGLSIDYMSDFPIIKEYARGGWWVAYFVTGIIMPLYIDSFISKVSNRISQTLLK